MAKNYLVQFGQGVPTLATGLAPTFTVFKAFPGGSATLPPGITEIPTSTGLYYFTYELGSTVPIAFVIDGFTTGLGASRYVVGNIDPIMQVDERLAELGVTAAINGSIGTSILAVIGTTASSFGSTAIDPATVIGFLKRMQEFNEGNSVFNKNGGVWDISARGNAVGASTMLIEKVVTDSGSVITKI